MSLPLALNKYNDAGEVIAVLRSPGKIVIEEDVDNLTVTIDFSYSYLNAEHNHQIKIERNSFFFPLSNPHNSLLLEVNILNNAMKREDQIGFDVIAVVRQIYDSLTPGLSNTKEFSESLATVMSNEVKSREEKEPRVVRCTNVGTEPIQRGDITWYSPALGIGGKMPTLYKNEPITTDEWIEELELARQGFYIERPDATHPATNLEQFMKDFTQVRAGTATFSELMTTRSYDESMSKALHRYDESRVFKKPETEEPESDPFVVQRKL